MNLPQIEVSTPANAWGRSCILFLIVAVTTGTAAAQLAVSMPDTQAAPGDTIAVPLTITDLEGEAGVFSLQFEITYSPDLVIAETVLANVDSLIPPGSEEWAFEFNITEGKAACALAGADSLIEEGILVRILFVVADTVEEGISPLHFEVVFANEGVPQIAPFDGSITVTTVGAEQEMGVESTPTDFFLQQNYPNPFNASTTLTYSVPWESRVRLSVVDLQGHEVAVLADGLRERGRHEVSWNGRDWLSRPLPSSVYFFRMSSGGFTQTRKLLLLK